MAKLTLDVAKEIAHSRGGECISERYINCQMPMFWKCDKDHLWSARLTSARGVQLKIFVLHVKHFRKNLMRDQNSPRKIGL